MWSIPKLFCLSSNKIGRSMNVLWLRCSLGEWCPMISYQRWRAPATLPLLDLINGPMLQVRLAAMMMMMIRMLLLFLVMHFSLLFGKNRANWIGLLSSGTRLGDIWKFCAAKLITKVARKYCWLLGYFEKYKLM